jgi:ribosome-binding protein aMBF1 (putative translation factor)
MTAKRKFETLDEYRALQMRDPDFAAAYREVKPETDFAFALAVAREKRGLTQQDLADKVDCKQQQIAKYERGVMPGAAVLQRLAQALNANITFETSGAVTIAPQ